MDRRDNTDDRRDNTDDRGDLTQRVMGRYGGANKNVIRDLLRVRTNAIVLLDCAEPRSSRDSYEVIGRLVCSFAPPERDVPNGVLIGRKEKDEFVPYQDIRGFRVLS